MVDARLADIKETAAGSKIVSDGQVFSMERITTDAKRKWEQFSLQAENDTKENADFSAAKTADLSCCCKKDDEDFGPTTEKDGIINLVKEFLDPNRPNDQTDFESPLLLVGLKTNLISILNPVKQKQFEEAPSKYIEVSNSRFINKADIMNNLDRKMLILKWDDIPKANDEMNVWMDCGRVTPAQIYSCFKDALAVFQEMS
ncbi:kinesin-like protein KIN-5C [Tanacetum coccineum]